MKCEKCKDTGLLPFTRKDGSIAHACYTDCDCKDLRETLQPVTVDAFDYAMSQSFRAYSFEYCGIPDPGYSPPATNTDVDDRLNDLEAEVCSGIPGKYTEELNQLKGRILHLQSKMIEKKKNEDYY
ncbi:hypothetical protein LCGC14_2082880 [marine sediment metagenome]|uniref:Uncharacterized protein n=1 Tax=marine sediment metagenome TaxID=412755 RepID=A0A0F9EEX6_9ZZZZ